MRASHSITGVTSIKHGYRLLCALFAAYDFQLLYRDSDPDPLDDFLQFADEEKSENIISLSAIARASDDELGSLAQIEISFPNGVGWLRQEGESQITLSIREACNKIIHAKTVKYDLAWSEENPVWGQWYKAQGLEVKDKFKAPALELNGCHISGKTWEARIELVPFIMAASLWDDWGWNLS